MVEYENGKAGRWLISTCLSIIIIFLIALIELKINYIRSTTYAWPWILIIICKVTYALLGGVVRVGYVGKLKVNPESSKKDYKLLAISLIPLICFFAIAALLIGGNINPKGVSWTLFQNKELFLILFGYLFADFICGGKRFNNNKDTPQ